MIRPLVCRLALADLAYLRACRRHLCVSQVGSRLIRSPDFPSVEDCRECNRAVSSPGAWALWMPTRFGFAG